MDYTVFTFPAASLTDTSTEEIELDQALSLAGRRGRRLFGVTYDGLLENILASLIADTADVQLSHVAELNTRTGAHGPESPEGLWREYVETTLNVTEGSGTGPNTAGFGPPPGGDVYVAPRLFFRQTNNIDATRTAGASGARIASVDQPLSFPIFIELLERFADVTLL